MPSAAFAQTLKTLQSEINQYLERDNVWVPDDESRLTQAMRYSLLAPGKRIRPILTLLACEACGCDRQKALPAALAIELVHTYSLIHDDLPAMDNDDLRRGRPTCHKAFDDATAILAGNALLTLAFEVLATGIKEADAVRHCLRILSEAAGYSGMVGGQMSDILQERQGQERQGGGTLELLRDIHSRKTGALIRAAIHLGALVGMAEQHEECVPVPLDIYARELGLAFQISDDLLDVQSNAGELGKATQKDAGKGKLTYPGLLGVEGARRELQLARERGLAAIDQLKDRGTVLKELFCYVVDRDH